MTKDSGSSLTRPVPAVEKAIEILQAFRDGHTQYGPAELGRMLNANRSTIFHILRTLQSYGFLQRDETTKKFKLGYALVELGQRVLRSMDLRSLAKPVMQELMDETGEMVVLSVPDRDSALVVELVESRGSVRTTISVGTRLPASATADGKVLLAWRPEEDLEAILRRRAPRRFTEASITDMDALRQELGTVRKRGYALDNEEYAAGVRGISAPIRDIRSLVIAAITLAGTGIPDQRMPELADRVLRAAGKASLLLGARSPEE